MYAQIAIAIIIRRMKYRLVHLVCVRAMKWPISGDVFTARIP